MVSQNVHKLLQDAASLSLEERQQLLESLKCLFSEEQATEPSGDELAAALAKKGVTLTVPPKPTPEEIERFRAWRPITLPGASLSDELVRDRR